MSSSATSTISQSESSLGTGEEDSIQTSLKLQYYLPSSNNGMSFLSFRVRSHAPSIRSYRGTKVVWPDFQPMRVPVEPVCIDLFRQNPVFTSLLLKSPVHVVQRRRTWTGDFKCREVKTGFYRNRSMKTGSSGTLIGWKSGQTTFVPLGLNGGSVATDSASAQCRVRTGSCHWHSIHWAEQKRGLHLY